MFDLDFGIFNFYLQASSITSIIQWGSFTLKYIINLNQIFWERNDFKGKGVNVKFLSECRKSYGTFVLRRLKSTLVGKFRIIILLTMGVWYVINTISNSLTWMTLLLYPTNDFESPVYIK